MFMLKACPRCRGDLYRDRYNGFTCLQCGHELRPGEQRMLKAQRSPARRATPVTAAP